MASLDWSQCNAVESVPGKVSGAWVLRGTRTPVKILFENFGAGMSIEEVIERFPVSRDSRSPLVDGAPYNVAKRNMPRLPVF